MQSRLRLSLVWACLSMAAPVFCQTAAPNNTLKGRVLFQSSGNKPAVGAHIMEKDSNGDYSKDNGDYRLVFQTKRNGAVVEIELGPDTRDGKKIELVNAKEVQAAKLPANGEDFLDIIVCPAGQRDLAAQKYYRILRTTADLELERKKKEVENLLAQKEKDYQKISDLFAQLDGMQAVLDSAKIQGQAFSIASINLDRASQMVKDAVQKIEGENDVAGALLILNVDALDTAYQRASALKKKAAAAIRQVIEGYAFKISLLEPQFKYGEIAECYEKIAGIYENEDYDKLGLVANLVDAATYWGRNGDYQKQLALNLKALDIREKILPANHPDIATSYNDLAVAYNNLGGFQKALELNQKALALIEKASPASQSDLATSYINLATTYNNLGDYEKALEFNLKALAIHEESLPADHLYLATTYNNLAHTYGNLSKHEDQLVFNLKALAIREKVLPAEHPDLALSYNNLAYTYGKLGNYQKSLEFNLKALAIREKILPANHPNLAQSYTNLALTYNKLRDYKKALELNLKAVAIRQQVLPSDHPELALSYNNLALTYGKLGEHQNALELHSLAMSIWEKTLPADHPDLATCYYNLSLTYNNLGAPQKQLEYNVKALAIWEKILPAEHPLLATSYYSMAYTYGNLGEYQKALEFGLKSLAIDEKVLPADHPDLVVSYYNIGRAYRDVGEYPKGIEYGLKAIQLAEAATPPPSYLNRFYASIGLTYTKARQYAAAKTALEKSESLNAKEPGVYKGWTVYYALQKQRKQSLENLQKCVAFGFKDVKWIESEPALKNIRKEKGYKELLVKLKQ